jgi:hypothetical protein
MNQEQNSLKQIKSDVKALLESFVSAFEFVETVDWFMPDPHIEPMSDSRFGGDGV